MIRLHAHGDHGYPLCADPTPDSSGLVVTTKDTREVDCPECLEAIGPRPGCCTECRGTGGSSSGPCWDCRGTGCAHEAPLCA